MKKSGQSALDYLLSWGWVLIVIAASLIALYSLGVFSVPSAPTLISGFPTVSVSAVAANSSLMVLKLSNNFGSPINLSDISVSISGKNYTALQCQKTILPQSQSSLCRVPVSISSSKYFAVVNINFLPYRSVVQLVSNGTISAGLYSGSLALNNEVTSFEAVDAPVGNSWAVTFDGVKKTQTVTSAPNGNIINFSEPFGVYDYNVSNLSASCSGAYPTPSKGTANTGALYKISFSGNCVTTFVEHGIPSSFNWQVNYSDPQSATAPAGTNLTFEAPVGVAYAYKAVPLSLACANSSVAVSGSVVNIDYWGCNTTISESNLPLGATGNGASSAVGWSMSFDGYNSPVSTSSSSLVTSKQVFSSLSPITPSASVSGLDCSGASAPSIYPGGSGTFSSWSCITSASESGVPLGATGDGASSTVGWSMSFDGYSSGVSTSSSSVSTPAATFTSFSPITPSASVSGLNCNGASAPSIYPGGSGTFSSWNCITSFSESGVPLGATGDGISGTLGWTAYYPAQSKTSVASSTSSSTLTYTDDGVSTISESNAGAGTDGLTCGGSNQYPTYLGGSVSFSSWDCITSLSESGVALGQTGGGISGTLTWEATFGSSSAFSDTSSTISLTQDNIDVSLEKAQGFTTGLNCNTVAAPEIYSGGTTSFGGTSASPWNCTTAVIPFGFPSAPNYFWNLQYTTRGLGGTVTYGTSARSSQNILISALQLDVNNSWTVNETNYQATAQWINYSYYSAGAGTGSESSYSWSIEAGGPLTIVSISTVWVTNTPSTTITAPSVCSQVDSGDTHTLLDTSVYTEMNGYDYICNTTTGDSYIFTVNYGSTPSGGAAEDIQSVSFPDPASYYHVYHYVGTAPSGNIVDNYGGACVTPSYNVNNSYISTAYISLPVVGTGNNPTQVFGAYASDGVTARVSCPDSIPLYYGISGTSSLPGTNTSFAYVYSGSVPLNWGITGAYIGYNSNDYTYISSADNDPGTADSYSHLNDLQTFLQLEQMPMNVSYTTPAGSGDGVTSTIDSATATSGSFIDVGYSPSGYASIAES